MSGALVPVAATAIEQAADPAQFVELACERAKEWLAQALEHGDIDGIVELKSQAEAIRTYTVQKQLGKDAELSAAEIVRRAERGIGIAIRRGQEAGEIAKPGDNRYTLGTVGNGSYKKSVTEVAPGVALHDTGGGPGVYALADVTDAAFEEAITEAKADQNLSRSNVVRKAQATGEESRVTKARRMAVEGYTSRQIGEAIGIKSMADFRARHGINVPADAVVGKTRRLDADRIINETVIALEGLTIGVNLLDDADVAALDQEQAANWATSLSNSLRSLNRLCKQLKEMSQ
jgi:hypothetical protein